MPMSPRLLRPRASAGYGLDAADWQNRVIANGGTVSASTMKAVDTFCKSIVTNGLRDRFYRLNLFCGDNLSACLVPLFRGPDRTGTQYGNSTDTNNGPFVSGDYAETGASGGLTGNGSTKFLNTGLAPNAVAEIGATGHLAVHGVVNPSTGGNVVIGTDNGSNQFWWIRQTGTTSFNAFSNYGGSVSVSATGSFTAGAFNLSTRRSSTELQYYANGVGGTPVTTSASPSALSTAFFVFQGNRSGSPIATQYAANTLGAYSIGASITGAQVTSYYNAMKAFQAALGRNAA